jgi:hypothetical protein
MRKLFLLITAIILSSFNNAKAQTPKQDLSKGNYLLMQKPFQIEAWSYPNFLVNGVLEDRFNPDFYAASNFTSFGVTHSGSELDDYPIEVQDKPWSRIEEVHHGMNTFELTKINTLFRLQFEDDNLHPTNTELVQYANLWFNDKRSNPAFDKTLLSLDLPFINYSAEFAGQLKNMVSLLKPDLILFNRYPWQKDNTYNHIQLLYGWYGMLIYYRNVALKGIDGTGNIPIPFGAYTQTWFAYQSTPPSYSQMRLNHFGSLAFGAKVLSAFVYNDYPGDANNTIKSILFKNELPTPQFYQQAEINRQITNLGPALLQLQTSDIRFIPRKSTATFPGGTDISSLKWIEVDKPRPDLYLKDVTATRLDPVNGENGDVLVGYFKPVHKSLDGTNTTNENYFIVVNGLYEADDNISTFQTISLNFDFGTVSTINSLLRLNRLTGNIEALPLIKESTTGNNYYFDLELNGGEGDLFKYNDGIPFVGFANLSNPDENAFVDKEILLFPNPATNQINLKTETRDLGSFYTIFDDTGKSVLFGKIKLENTIIELDPLSSGIYMLNVGGNKNQTFKVVKK